jgi:prepilin-type N-terminal cleavage/methylation domain-containing protein
MRSRTRTSGFTLIELLIVVVIIGILASIALPQFWNTRGKAAAAALKSDLHNLTTAQESYYSDAGLYTSNLTALKVVASPSVTLAVATATGSGWSATATNPQAVPGTCAVFYGAATPLAPATTEGVVACQ